MSAPAPLLFFKSHVKGHARHLKNGTVAFVAAHEDGRAAHGEQEHGPLTAYADTREKESTGAGTRAGAAQLDEATRASAGGSESIAPSPPLGKAFAARPGQAPILLFLKATPGGGENSIKNHPMQTDSAPADRSPPPFLFFKDPDLAKAYIPAHTRRLKNGKLVQVAAYYDKRSKKGMEHAPAHGHHTDHLSAEDRATFDRMHAEQHLLHHYHGHALRRRIAAAEAELIQHHAEAVAHRDAGRQTKATASANQGLKVNARLIRHRKELAEVDAKVAGIGAMKETLVAGSGALEASTDATHDRYVKKLGARWKPQDAIAMKQAAQLPRGVSLGGPVEIRDLYRAVQSEAFPKNEKRAIRYATETGDERTARLSELAGVDLSGWSHAVDSFAMIKVHKDHGTEKTETTRGQLPITEADWMKLPEIIAHYDTVDAAGVDGHGTPLIRYSKRFNGTIYYVEEVRGKRRELAAKTMWKTRTAMSGASGPALTSETLGRSPHDGEGALRANPSTSSVAATARADKSADPPSDFDLSKYSNADILKREDAARRRREAEAEADRQAERRQEADRARGDFVLTGSKRPTDQLSARGQGSLFGFSTRFGPTGEPLHQARPDRPLLFFASAADREAFLKAYVHGHYRVNQKTGQTVWVDSYSDKRPEKTGQKTAFAHWNHRLEHVKTHLAHGLHKEALHAFHDLSHDDAHRLATDLKLHDGQTRHASKKELMEQLREAMTRRGAELQAKVQAQRAARPETPVKPKPKAPAPSKPQAAPAPPAPAGPDPDDLTVDVAGHEVPFAWTLVDAADLTPTEGHAANQYRDRTRAASEEQVQNIAGNLKFRLLADSPLMDYGAPVLAHDGQTIIGGNGRSLAIRRAYQSGKADDYRAALQRKAARFGIDPGAVAQLQAPVLVRVLQKDVDIKQAAIASNEGGGARMSALEQARVDGERLGDLQDCYADDDGNLNTKANLPFIRRFLAAVPVSQRPAFQGSDGGLSQEGTVRLRNAVLHRAYGDSDLLARMVESTDPGQRNVLAALTRVAPTVAGARDDVQAGRLYGLDIAPDIVAAAVTLAKVREDKTFGSVADYLNQQTLFGDGLSEESQIILRHFDTHLRSAKAIGAFLRDYYDAVRRIGDPNQGSMFGDPIPEKSTLLRDAHDRANAPHPTQAGLL